MYVCVHSVFFVFFFLLCHFSRFVRGKACVSVRSHLLTWPCWPEPQSCRLIYPPFTRPARHDTAPCLQRWRTARRPLATPPPWPLSPAPTLLPRLLPPRFHSRRRKRKVGKKEDASWRRRFRTCWCGNQTLALFFSAGKDGWVPAGQVSGWWCEVQGQADRHWWRSRGQRRQDVPGLHDETEGAASEYRRSTAPLEFRANIKEFASVTIRLSKLRMINVLLCFKIYQTFQVGTHSFSILFLINLVIIGTRICICDMNLMTTGMCCVFKGRERSLC